MRIGALEAGGTKMVCAVGDENGVIYERISIPTETPEITMPKLIDFFQKKEIETLGIGCFGPIDLDKKSATYGHITSTPKIPWRNYNIVGAMKDALAVPIGFDTDVNGSMLGEAIYGCAQDVDHAIYITVGTGVGLGVYIDKKLLHGRMHPEAGHILLMKHPSDVYVGKCPYHKACLEGLAAGPAIEARWGKKGIELQDREEVWRLEAFYIAQAIVNYVYVYSPQRIILGGGVMHQEQLLPLIREEVKRLNNDYISRDIMGDLEKFIVPSSLNDNQGILGAIALGYKAAKEASGRRVGEEQENNNTDFSSFQ